MINSKQKGKTGELEAAKLLQGLLGCSARRGQQFKGTPESPDLVGAIPGVHIEVKRVEKLNLVDAVAQADRDKGEREVSMVLHRKNRSPWLITVKAEDLLQFIGCVSSLLGSLASPLASVDKSSGCHPGGKAAP